MSRAYFSNASSPASRKLIKPGLQDNVFSGLKEVIMFSFKFCYFVFFFFIKISGEKYLGRSFSISASEFLPYGRIIEFAVNSTVQGPML